MLMSCCASTKKLVSLGLDKYRYVTLVHNIQQRHRVQRAKGQTCFYCLHYNLQAEDHNVGLEQPNHVLIASEVKETCTLHIAIAFVACS